MTLVVDASVAVKWLLNDSARDEADKAMHLMQWALQGHEPVIQPVHWLVEVGAVLSRLSPQTAEEDVAMLEALELPVESSPLVLRRACRIAIDLGQHMFDTLYHAVALETPDAVLITADEKYLQAASKLGCVQNLRDWAPGR